MRISATPRIVIETIDITVANANLFVGWLNDPEVVKYSEQRHKTHTTQSQVDYWLSAATVTPNGVYGVYLHPTLQLIGSVSYQIDTHNKVANVGIMIGDKSVWGKGYGYESWAATCNYLFYSDAVRKIEAGCMATNSAMNLICRKYGMTEEGIRADHFLVDGKPEDMMMYGKFHP